MYSEDESVPLTSEQDKKAGQVFSALHRVRELLEANDVASARVELAQAIENLARLRQG
jgi:hypothetical protein